MGEPPTYERLVADAQAGAVQGWDFTWMAGRAVGLEPSWSYTDTVVGLLPHARRVLDIDTGGGELLAHVHTLTPLPLQTTATEGWAPNLPLATACLTPLGVRVLPAPGARLPVPRASVDLVLNRHGRLVADEVTRVLAPGGRLHRAHPPLHVHRPATSGDDPVAQVDDS
jgi:SAM-dependent methyltransferase